MEKHCLEKIDGEKVIMFGGRDNEFSYYDPGRRSSVVDLSGNQIGVWKDIDYLNTGRWTHACGVLSLGQQTEIVVAAGGRHYFYTWYPENGDYYNLDSVEFLAIHQGDFASAKWEYGPKLPVLLSRAASATTMDRKRLYVAGGFITEDNSNEENVLSPYVLHLHCSGDTVSSCTWIKNTFELWHPMSASTAMILPPYSKLSSGTYLSI